LLATHAYKLLTQLLPIQLEFDTWSQSSSPREGLPSSIQIDHDGFCNYTRIGVFAEVNSGISSASRPFAIAIDESQYLAWLKSTTLKCWVSKRMQLVMISRRLTLSEVYEAVVI
jgi:hypothetical protein